MKSKQHFGRTDKQSKLTARVLLSLSLLGFGATLVAGVTASAPQAHAQNFGQRTIDGLVYGTDGKTLDGATIFLKNAKTHNVRSFTSQAGGAFRFAQVGMADDYDVWAEHANTKSAVKTISSFDSRKEVRLELKLK